MNQYKYIDEDGEHLHTLDGRALLGTSTITGVISKNLTWWSAELSAVECLEAGEKIPTIREEYLEACNGDKKKNIDALQKKYPIFKKARFAHFGDKNTKAKKGTDMHALMEDYVNECINTNNGIPLATMVENLKLGSFVSWSINNVSQFKFSEKYVYSKNLWSGGIFDIIFIMKDGKTIIGDFKSSPIAYDSQFIQVAGYDEQQSENGIFDKDGNKLSEPLKIDAYIVFPFGAEVLKPEIRYNTLELRSGFKCATELYKLTNH